MQHCRDLVKRLVSYYLPLVLADPIADYAIDEELFGLVDDFASQRVETIAYPERCWRCHRPVPCEHSPDMKRYQEKRVAIEVCIPLQYTFPAGDTHSKLEIWIRRIPCNLVERAPWKIAIGTVIINAFRILTTSIVTYQELSQFLRGEVELKSDDPICDVKGLQYALMTMFNLFVGNRCKRIEQVAYI